MTLNAGTRIGPYEILELRGQGGMGEVYRARDTRLGRDVAVKVVPPSLSADATFRRRFEREAKTIARLQHPHVCTIHDVGREQEVDYLVMEYLEGETLGERLRRGPLPLEDVVQIGTEIAGAVAAAHGQGIVHRDIKPGNVMLTAAGSKVLDFGLAKEREWLAVEEKSDSPTLAQPLTREGSLLGTIHYMAPEQLEGREADSRSDVWALGCVLYEMTTGRRPFAADSAARLAADILSRDPESLRGVNPPVPEALAALVSRCLRKGAAERPKDAADLLAQLMLVSSGPPGPSTRRLLILPFSQPGADENLDYLCEGIAGSLIGKLGGVRGLRVVALNTAVHVQVRGQDPIAAGHELGVDAVLTGRLRLVGGQLVVHAELLDVASGTPRWSERMRRPFGDVFEVEEEVARSVAGELEVELGGAASARVTARPTESSTAYRYYLEGRHFTYRGTPQDSRRAIERYQAALREDPTFARAHAGLSLAHSWGSFFNYFRTIEARDDAISAARRAAELDPSLPEAHAALGFALCFLDWDWEAADRALLRGVELGPESATALQSRYVCLLNLGHLEEALGLLRRCMEIDPLWVKGNQDHGFLLICLHRYEEARAQLERTLELDPDFLLAHFCMGFLHLEMGQAGEAVERLDRIGGAPEAPPFFRASLAYALARSGDAAAARRLAEELARTAGDAIPAPLAWVYCGLDDPNEAARWAELAFGRRSPLLVNLGWWPWFKELRGHPKYRELTKRMKLPIVLDA
jgi:TolB-like protein/tetratricopeptide (TPR) repeat protein